MSTRHPRNISTLRRTALLAGFAIAPAALAAGPVMYSSVPADPPGNVTSQAFEATGAVEAGDRITFVAGTGGMVRSVTVVLSSWACEEGEDATCKSKKGKTFNHPITLNLYADNGGGTPGALIASMTKTFKIPYRPSASTNCPDGRWFDSADIACYSGIATDITFDFPSPGLNVPDTLIWTIAFNTTHYGSPPLGESAPCYTQSGGCPYDALNLGAQTLALVGTDVDPNGAFLNTSVAVEYCDGGAGGTGTLRLDDGCWTDFRPLAEFIGPTSRDCRKNGWQSFTNPPFANEAACKAFFDSL
jgi:hypothetical protein